MSNYSALPLNQTELSDNISLKLILKLPKRYFLGKVLLSLLRLTEIQITFLGELTGRKQDSFNWSYLEITGSVLDLINANLFLEVLQIDINIVEIVPESLI